MILLGFEPAIFGLSALVEWQTLRGILENAVYGCRVDNNFDLRLVRQYVKDIFARQASSN